ncbi:glycosyltransferase [Methylobacterium sp. E-016]|jgi:UDP:flavonoid glycosyltransferase YjiC (YdhE family)|uniref:glycosyltransferase n=1 Tax=Methylobacterium sp. E-016 TaxID=2836556 RepID=UPI001FB8B411|nr:nucleotide disphospho-sugar-binding domain-containing protein [Methylobacterium sp. E-016]MCJ2076560.1 glycosyltransferase [Methylobacterium sp. E-016]
MRVQILAVGTHGDVLPMVAIGVELVRRGHAVTLVAPAPFTGLAARAGLAFYPLCTQAEYDRLLGTHDLWRPWRGAQIMLAAVAAMAEPAYRWIASEQATGGGVVVTSTLGLGARVAQDKLALPIVMVHVTPFLMESRYAPPRLPGLPLPRLLPARFRHWIGRGADRYVIDPSALPGLNAFRTTLDLPPVRRLRHWWNLAPTLILMFPRWYAPPQPDWPTHALQVGFPVADRFGDAAELSEDLAAFLRSGSAPLVFTYGSGMRRGRPFFKTAREICDRMGCRGILLAPQAGQVPPDLPPHIIHVPYAPLAALLPHAAALIHHGGIGTVAQGLAAGIPQLVVPVAFDHFDEARRLIELGVGASLSRRRFSPDRGARALHRLLNSPSVSEACTSLRIKSAASDGVRDACDAIERVGGL